MVHTGSPSGLIRANGWRVPPGWGPTHQQRPDDVRRPGCVHVAATRRVAFLAAVHLSQTSTTTGIQIAGLRADPPAFFAPACHRPWVDDDTRPKHAVAHRQTGPPSRLRGVCLQQATGMTD